MDVEVCYNIIKERPEISVKSNHELTDGLLKSIRYWDTLKQDLLKRHSIEKETLPKLFKVLPEPIL